MPTKLTLAMNKSVIEEAKKYAKIQGCSLSNLVEAYLKSVLSTNYKIDNSQLSPITKSLYGSVKMKNSNINYKEILIEKSIKL